MTGQEIATLIAAITGALVAIGAGIRNMRGDKFNKEVAASAALLNGYTSMVATLQGEIDRLKSDAAEDRAAAQAERTRMRDEYQNDLERLRAEHRTELRAAAERIDELSAQVYTLTHPPETCERQQDS